MIPDSTPSYRPLTRTNTVGAAATADMDKEPPDKTTDSMKKNKLLARQKGNFSSDLHMAWESLLPQAYSPKIVTPLIVPAILSQLRGSGGKTAVQEFLKDQDGRLKMDDCVRWYLLYHAVDLENADERHPKHLLEQVSDEIISRWPYLAFENPYDAADSRAAYEGACVDKKQHQCKRKGTPFHAAAKCGNDRAMASMIRHGKTRYGKSWEGSPRHPRSEWPLVWVVQQPDPETKDTALMLAAKTEKGSEETLKELLQVPGIAVLRPESTSPGDPGPRGDATFSYALEFGLAHVVETLLGTPGLPGQFVTTDAILLALNKLDDAVDDPTMGGRKMEPADHRAARVKMAKSLAGRVEDEAVVDRAVADMIIRKGEVGIWEALPEDKLSEDLRSCLLHLAVVHQNPAFVAKFVEYAGSVSKKWAAPGDGKPQYALWYNNNLPGSERPEPASPSPEERVRMDKAREVKNEIRRAIVTKMIHEVSAIEELSEIFYDSDEQVSDICFDMSRFNSVSHEVSEFVDSLVRENSTQELFSYESTLRYAEFPPLDVRGEEREFFRDNCHLHHQHTEVFEVFDWLKGKGVETIIELRVPDRLINPHDDGEMAKRVDEFKVKVLDWRVLDLCISVLHEGTRDRLTDLHLYSSGKRAVIDHWFSEKGILSLKNETCTLDRANKLIEEIDERLEALPVIDKGEAICVTWSPNPKMADLNMVAHRIAPKLAQWTKGLNSYIKEKEADPQNMPHRPTRVAILDNGILSISPKLNNSAGKRAAKGGRGPQPQADGDGRGQGEAERADQYDDNRSLLKRIKGGRSFVDGTHRLSPWLFASNPHGTQMANLICAIDPCCDIYVARVAEDAHGITPKRVEKAIAWARSRKVDVISMSFVIGEKTPELKTEIEKATKEGIVMTCSTHDEGSRIEEAFPASYMHSTLSLIVLAACDEYGRVLLEVDKAKYHYLLQGQRVAAGAIAFLDSEETVTGSSVATALAAGVCSLALTCGRLASPHRRYAPGKDAGSRYELVTKELDRMTSGDNRFILLDKFGGIAELATGGSGNPPIAKILENFKHGWEF